LSLRWRLALIFAGVIALMLGAISVGAYRSAEREIVDEIDQFLVTRADQLLQSDPNQGFSAEMLEIFRDQFGRRRSSGRARPPVGALADEFRRQAFAGFDADAAFQELDRSGRPVGGLVLPIDETDRSIAAGIGPGRSLRTVVQEGETSRMITVARPAGGAVQVSRDLSESLAALGDLRSRLIGFGIVGAVTAAIAGWFVASTLTRPLEKLRVAAGQIADSKELDEPIPIGRQDEVGDLTVSFNTMAEALATSRGQQRRLVLDAGHELRTPLTSLRTNVELLQRGYALPPEEQEAVLDDLHFEVTELSEMVDELIDLATQTEHTDEPFEILRLDELVESVVERARRRTGRPVNFTPTPSAVRGRAAQLERAVTNLLTNAHKFAPPGDPIDVIVHGAMVVVRDTGPGVPVEDRVRIFDRFYRADAARTLPGSGLGLAIVAQVVAAHGGRVWVEGPPTGGAVFVISLPEVGP